MYDGRTRWPRLTRAIARYIAGPVLMEDDLADAADTVADYEVFRATMMDEPSYGHLQRVIRKAVAERHRFTGRG